ncbi:MAG: D-hexose-6-phosphate mutarotase [Mariprofundaceae bacterium]|nr:D-hexose-6-phosphate mutarotase [Mariprofundaceae bacterium]
MGDISVLNEAWGIEGSLSFKLGKGDMPVIEINNAFAQASIALQGAHILSFQPESASELIWMSEDATFAPKKSLRGGVPICWPWFGPHASDSSLPGHGPARTEAWKPIASKSLADGRTSISLEMQQNEQVKAVCGHPLQVQLHIVVGKSLEITLETKNLGDTSFTLGQALHTYFNISDVRNVHIEGLEGCEYLDKVDGFTRKKQDGAVTISQETDRVYVNTGSQMRIVDEGMKRVIVIRNQGSASAIVWNPWIETAAKMGDLGQDGYLHMLCVETANALDDVVELAAEATYTMATEYSIEAV